MENLSKTNYKNFFYISVLLLTDAIAYLVAFIFSIFTRILLNRIDGVNPFNIGADSLLTQSWWFLILYLFILISFGLYSARQPFWTEAKQLITASLIAFLLTFTFVSLGKLSDQVSRLMVTLLWFYVACVILIFRYFIKNQFYKFDFFSKRTIIVGKYTDACAVASSLTKERYLGFKVTGIVTLDEEDDEIDQGFPLLGNLKSIRKVVKSHNIGVAVFLPGLENEDKASELTGRLQLMLSQIIFIPTLNREAFSNVQTVQTLMTRLSYYQINNNLKSLTNRFMKRTLDLVLCIISLPFMLVITLIIGIIIKATSKGPVFYAHRRVGRHGRKIWILKFRSMYRDADIRLKDILMTDPQAKAEWDTTFKLKKDPRITPIGHFLRSTSLDELPQVFNVILGDMSLIGPRPVIQDELDLFYKDFASYYLMMRPGITGLWQISGRSDSSYDFRVARDTWYVLNWSVWLDLVILLKTVAVVLKKEGAY